MWRQTHYRAAVDTAVDAILVVDAIGIIQSVNPATERIFGYGSSELIGRNVSLLMPADHASGHDSYLDSYRRSGERKIIGVGRSVMGRRKTGSLFPVELSIAEWIADDGQRFFTGILRDVGEYSAAKAALKESQEWLRTVSDTALAGLVVIDRAHCIRFANRAYAVLFDLPSHDLVGVHMRDVLPDLYDVLIKGRLDASFAGARTSYETVYPIGGDPSRRRSLAATYEPSRSSAGDEVVVVVVTDVTELKRNEVALMASRDLLQSVIDGTVDAIFAKDAAGRYVVINESGAKLIGKSRDAILGKHDNELWGEAAARPFTQHDRLVMDSGTPIVMEQTLDVDGQIAHLLVTKRPWAGPDGLSGGIVGITRNVTEQRRMAIEREEIAKGLMRAQESERLRIARELHDQVGQDLTGLAFGLKDLQGDVASGEAKTRVAWLRHLTDQISSNLHRTARELRPTSLEDLGLRGAITSHVSEWSAHFKLQVDLHLDALDTASFDSDTQLAIYRCVQEGLTNIVKHAKATSVSVVAQRTTLELRVIVEDNGVGFEADDTASRPATDRLGLIGMRERIGHVGGRLTLESSPDRGTSLFIALPIREEKPQ